MNAESLIRLIKREFPFLKWNNYRELSHGWDHTVVNLDNKIIFRTPKKSTKVLKFELYEETQLLHALKKRIRDVGIPKYEYISKDKSAAGYTMLAGQELTPAVFNRLTDSDKNKIAIQLASFLTSLHGTTKNILAKRNVRHENEVGIYKELIRNANQYIYPRVNRSDITAIKNYLAEYDAFIRHGHGRTFVHNDLTGEHILWDRVGQKVNIIDFSDRVIGDPAIDFAGLFEYGSGFATRVHDHYHWKADDCMMKRARLYYQRIPLYIMADAFRGYPCTFKDGYTMFRNRFDGH